jgi:UDP:flavonoid glycosyltransferase YjiC (YdhE family)
MLPTGCDVLFMALGTRGDVQYMLKAGRQLKDRFNARVRIATHPNFQWLVEDEGLEFFNAGGDPDFMIDFWLENPTAIPKISTFRSGQVRRIRNMFCEMLEGYWAACVDLQGGSTTANNFKNIGGLSSRPFVADVIIATPPNSAHAHCAERLGVPLLLITAQPQAPTRAFPHINASSSKIDFIPSFRKYLSHVQSDAM